MKQSIDFSSITNSLSRFFGRFHGIIFFLIVGISLISAMYVIVTIINISGTTASIDSTISPTFDEATLKRVGELNDSDSQNTSFEFPSGRTNPFVE